MGRVRSSIALVLVSMAVWLMPPAAAHEVRPAIADVRVTPDAVEISIRMALESLAAGIDLSGMTNTNDAPEAAIYDRFRGLPPDEFEAVFREAWPRIAAGILIETGQERVQPEIVSVAVPAIGNIELPRDSILTLRADLPAGDAGVIIGWRANYGVLIIRQVGAGANAYEDFLAGGAFSDPLPRIDPAAGPRLGLILRYVTEGIGQIIPTGGAHMAFVLGMFFFAPGLRPVATQGAAFGLGAVTTLSLSAFGAFPAFTAAIGPLIAATLVYVGLDNIFRPGPRPLRTALVFGCGLVHGVAFAALLSAVGIPEDRVVEVLIGFSVGVTIALLAVVGLAFFAVGAWFGEKPWYHRAIAVPVSALIAALGAYTFVERTGLIDLPALL
ncbi:MAG: HupE/UreJ family protein [Pseudomonadota bacterium]